MLESIRLYRVDKGQQFRVMATYSTGESFDKTIPAGNTDPVTIQLPQTPRGEASIVMTIDSRPVLDSRETPVNDHE
jgi:hypothetical protein